MSALLLPDRFYASSVCSTGHDCDSLSPCEWNDVHGCDNQLYCDAHLVECAGCKRKFCVTCAGEDKADLRRTNCGTLCTDCQPEYCAADTVPALFGFGVAISSPSRFAAIGNGLYVRVGRRARA